MYVITVSFFGQAAAAALNVFIVIIFIFYFHSILLGCNRIMDISGY